MTDSAVATIPEGEGYHTFRGPCPIVWDQIYLMMMMMIIIIIIIFIIFMRS